MATKAEELLTELMAAQAAIGDTVWANFIQVPGLPANLPAELSNVAEAARRRRGRIDAAASAVSALIADGYPTPPQVVISAEAKQQINDIIANLKLFLGIP